VPNDTAPNDTTPNDATEDAGVQRAPEGPPGGSAVFLLSKLGFDASRRFQEALRPVDLEPRQFGVLNVVALGEGKSQQALGEALQVPASRMVAIVDDLEERGLVERRRNPDDRRAHALYLTDEGRRVLDEGRRLAMENEQRFCAPLQPAEREQLLGLLRRLAADQDLPLGVHPGLVAPDPTHPRPR
jgi:DNA-binding MarR family transcriptional regulator